MKPQAATLSTSPLSVWLEPHPKLDGLALIDHLFNRLDGMYPHKWRSAFANDHAVANWRMAWAEGFADEGITLEEVRCGLRACRSQDWPPSFAEFFKSCRPPIDSGAALIEAVEQMRRRDTNDDAWSHPAIYWAAAKIGSFDLLSRTTKDLEPIWRRELQDQMSKGEWSDIPRRVPALPAPGQQHTEAHAKAVMAEMMAKLRGRESAE
jgi:hypothetical protein